MPSSCVLALVIIGYIACRHLHFVLRVFEIANEIKCQSGDTLYDVLGFGMAHLRGSIAAGVGEPLRGGT
jgi:hypothetical protein